MIYLLYSSGSQTLGCIRISWNTCSNSVFQWHSQCIWCSIAGVGPKCFYFQYVLKWYWCCWLRNHTGITTAEGTRPNFSSSFLKASLPIDWWQGSNCTWSVPWASARVQECFLCGSSPQWEDECGEVMATHFSLSIFVIFSLM